jgi:hypothetical protein
MIGSRIQVFRGTAHKTHTGLVKKHLKRTPRGRIVSKAKSQIGRTSPALKAWRQSVKAAGGLKKGKFVLIKGALATRARKIFAKKNY